MRILFYSSVSVFGLGMLALGRMFWIAFTHQTGGMILIFFWPVALVMTAGAMGSFLVRWSFPDRLTAGDRKIVAVVAVLFLVAIAVTAGLILVAKAN